MKFAAVGFVCVDVYQNLGVRYPTGNGIDLMFNLMDLMPDIEPAVIAAVGDDDHGRMLLDICEKKHVDTSHVRIVKGGTTPTVEMRMNGTDRVHYHTERGVAECYQPTGEEMDFIRKQEVIHTDLSWHVTDLLPDMRKLGTQIYFDFSGYSDMAIGMGRCLGFHFNENFRHPYCCTSITDFWRRWHISLGSFFRDYVYIPMGGHRRHQAFHILVVWFLTGMWHGASWNFII